VSKCIKIYRLLRHVLKQRQIPQAFILVRGLGVPPRPYTPCLYLNPWPRPWSTEDHWRPFIPNIARVQPFQVPVPSLPHLLSFLTSFPRLSFPAATGPSEILPLRDVTAFRSRRILQLMCLKRLTSSDCNQKMLLHFKYSFSLVFAGVQVIADRPCWPAFCHAYNKRLLIYWLIDWPSWPKFCESPGPGILTGSTSLEKI